MGVIENRIDILELERSGGGGGGTAASVSYDNTGSGLTANTVQGAIDEVTGNLGVLEDEKAGKKQISNRNLLDNGWFTVNQRVETTYNVAGYTVDRWKINGGSLVVSDNGVTFTASEQYTSLSQLLPSDIFEVGKDYTLTYKKSDGTYYSKTFTYADSESWANIWDGDISGFYSAYRTTGGVVQFMVLNTKSSEETSVSIRAIKLEVGSISTLHMDAAPNYAEELLKCQRYFQRVTAGNIVTSIFPGYALTANGARFALPLLPMRAVPTVTPSAVTSFGASKNTAANAVIPDTITVSGRFGNTVVIELAKTGGFTAESVYMFCQTVSNAYLDLSADL